METVIDFGKQFRFKIVQAILIIALSLGSIEIDCVISEPCYSEVSYYRHTAK